MFTNPGKQPDGPSSRLSAACPQRPTTSIYNTPTNILTSVTSEVRCGPFSNLCQRIMAGVFRRFLSTTTRTSSASASDAVAEILGRFKDSLISTREQVLDANQARLLSLSLGRRSLHDGLFVEEKAPPTGTPLPPGYHLVYFTPSFLETELGLDGTDRSANPLHPFTRRMWAGGDLQWSKDPERLLRIGQTVTETTRILSAEPKRTKASNEMIVVGVEKQFENKNGIALVDKRFAQCRKYRSLY